MIVVIVAAVITAACWVLSLITKDYSWVDRSWSISPVIYTWIFAWPAWSQGMEGARTIILALLITAWGARLTFNFARKGGYSGVEDYRWPIVMSKMKPWQRQVFNLLFIAIYQNILLVLITLPIALSADNPAGLRIWDVVFLSVFLLLLVFETVADQQQWNFQQAKKQAGGDMTPGFVTTGLFRYSRHPNYFAEQGQWWMVYCVGAAGVLAAQPGAGLFGGAINWTLVGAMLLSLLFIGSRILTESLSMKKYPEYVQYRESTSATIPLPPRPRPELARQ